MDNNTRNAIIEIAGCLVQMRHSLIVMDHMRRNPQLPGIFDVENQLEQSFSMAESYIDNLFKILDQEFKK